MKKLAVCLVALSASMALMSGCKQSTSQVGDKKLTLTKPSNVAIHRGGTDDLTVRISREGFSASRNWHIDQPDEQHLAFCCFALITEFPVTIFSFRFWKDCMGIQNFSKQSSMPRISIGTDRVRIGTEERE